MKLIKQSKLFFKEGNSDKVYEIDLCELNPDSFLVNFRYGRRGGPMKEGTKTPAAVSSEKAEALFNALENEKRKKGYQTESEVFIELPSLDTVKPDSVEGVIMHRLQDAVEGKNSFKTEWKTSRVIWKAGMLGMQEAIPYIIKLASKGDEVQKYTALYVLTLLKAEIAEELFRSYAFSTKIKAYIRQIANEGLLTILEGEKLIQHEQTLLALLPEDIKTAIESNNNDALEKHISASAEKEQVDYLSILYLLAKRHTYIATCLSTFLIHSPARPPFFRQMRHVYKLAQLRNDFKIMGILSFRFEKEKAMFNRTADLDSDYGWQYIESLNNSFQIGKELKKDNSRIAFSQFTKRYLQRNSFKTLINTGLRGNAKEYLNMSVPILLQYTEDDYTLGGEVTASESYDWSDRQYLYIRVNQVPCSRAILLNLILFGNDKRLMLEPNLTLILGKRYLKSESWGYDESKMTEIKRIGFFNTPPQKPGSQEIAIKTRNLLDTLLPKKRSEAQQSDNQYSPNRLELFPEYWDAMPEAYISLLIKSKMYLVQQFAYNRLKERPDVVQLTDRLDKQTLIGMFKSETIKTKMPHTTNENLPAKFAFEILLRRENEFKTDIPFITILLDSDLEAACQWAMKAINAAPEYFTADFDFVYQLIFMEGHYLNNDWLTALLENADLPEDRVMALLGRIVADFLSIDESSIQQQNFTNEAIVRLNLIAKKYYNSISDDIAVQLFSAPFSASRTLGSFIIYEKSKSREPEDIPLSITGMFLESSVKEVHEVGVKFLENYPDKFLVEQASKFFNLAYSERKEIVAAVLERTRSILQTNSQMGEYALLNLSNFLIRKEKYEGAHQDFKSFIINDLKPFHNQMNPSDLIRLIHSNYRPGHLAGYEILENYERANELTIGQIVSLGNHEIFAIRQWCWKYFKENTARIRYERDKALGLLDSKWDDTRAFAFNFFETEFSEKDWDVDTLIGITDSVRADVEQFGKTLITKYFKPENALEYLTKLSEHPSVSIQMFVSTYLSHFVAGDTAKLIELDYYFRSTLCRVNKGRVAKDRIFEFLSLEAMKSEEAAHFVGKLVDDLSAQTTVQDKATCIDILTAIENHYPGLKMHLTILN